MRLVTAVMAAAVLGMAACGGETTAPDGAVGTQHSVHVGDEVRLRLNDVAVVLGTQLRLKFVGVPADSRCPIDVTCVWMGDAAVRMDVSASGGAVRHMTLHTGEEPKAMEIEAHRIELLEVAPARSSDVEIRQQDYSVRLRITRV